MSARLLHLFLCLILATLTLVALGKVCGHDFINLDDGIYVTDNPAVQQGLTLPGVVWAWTRFHAGYWIPMTWMSLQLDATLFWPQDEAVTNPASQAAWGFHLTNLILHLANVLLLYWLLWRWTGAPWRAAVVAAIFAVHPLHVESVAWITERKDVLSTLLFLLTLFCFERYVRTGSRRDYLLALLLFGLGLAAKPILVTLPCVLLLLDYWPWKRVGSGEWRVGSGERGVESKERKVESRESNLENEEGKTKYNPVLSPHSPLPAPRSLPTPHSPLSLLLEKAPFFLISLAYGVLTLRTQYYAGAVTTTLSLENRITTALHGYGWYLAKTFWPTNLGLLYPLEIISLGSPRALVPLGILVLISVVALLLARKLPALIVGWLWFLGTLFPVSGIMQSGDQGMADRFVYLPHIGLFIALVWCVADGLKLENRPGKILAGLQLAGACLVIGWFASLTWKQVDYWKNTGTIMEHSVLVVERNHRAYECWGEYLLEKKNYDGALNMANRALRIQESPRYYLLQAKVYEKLRGYQEEKNACLLKMAQLLKKQMDIEYTDPQMIYQLGQALFLTGDIQQALQYLSKSLQMNEGQWDVHYTLGLIHQGLNQNEEAEVHLARSVELNPKAHQGYDRLGVSLARQLKWAQAQEQFTRAVQLKPDAEGVDYRAHLAFAYGQMGRQAEAQEEFARVRALVPLWPWIAVGRAVKLATDPNPGLRDLAEALELAQQAGLAVETPDADFLESQAMVYAAASLFPQALVCARQALERVGNQPERRQSLQEKIALYQQLSNSKYSKGTN